MMERMTIYSKEMKTTRRDENTMKEILRGDFNGIIGEKGARNWEEERGYWEKKIHKQGGKCRKEEEVLNENKRGDEKRE
jgi:hypothetical protein